MKNGLLRKCDPAGVLIGALFAAAGILMVVAGLVAAHGWE